MSFWKQLPPKPTEAERNLGPTRESVPMECATCKSTCVHRSAPASTNYLQLMVQDSITGCLEMTSGVTLWRQHLLCRSAHDMQRLQICRLGHILDWAKMLRRPCICSEGSTHTATLMRCMSARCVSKAGAFSQSQTPQAMHITYLLHICASCFAQGRDGVDGRDPLSQECVGSQLGQLGRPQVCTQDALIRDPVLIHTLQDLHCPLATLCLFASNQHLRLGQQQPFVCACLAAVAMPARMPNAM